jgi:hypothetical protein
MMCGNSMEVRIAKINYIEVHYIVLHGSNELQGTVAITEDTSSWTYGDFKEHIIEQIKLMLSEEGSAT